MPATEHSDNVNLLTQAGSTFFRAGRIGVLTDAIVNASTTRQALLDAVSGVAAHADGENWKDKIHNAVQVSGLTDADINGVTTVAGLVALFPQTPAGSQAVLD